MANLMPTTRNFADVLRKKIEGDPELAAAVEDERFNAYVANQIHEARTRAGLTQSELAARVGTYQQVVSRLENADYDGHSLTMLRKIGQALNLRTRVEFYASPQTIPSETVYSKTVKWESPTAWDAESTSTT